MAEFVARIVVELRVFGWCITAKTDCDTRDAMRSSSIAALCERREDLDGWWDRDIAALWMIRVDRGLGTDRPPFWYALSGLLWTDRGAWWLHDDVEAGHA